MYAHQAGVVMLHNGNSGVTAGSTAGTLTGGATTCTTLVMTFPSCCDGHTLDGATQTNVGYPGTGDTCPADHPVRIPQIALHETYPTSSAQNLTLSMGPGMAGTTDTAHADFVNGWTQRRSTRRSPPASPAARHAAGHWPDATPAHPDALVNPDKARQPMSSAAARPTS